MALVGLAACATALQAQEKKNSPEAPGSEFVEVSPGRVGVKLRAAGHEWWYLAQIPRVYDGKTPFPVVILLHGMGGSADTYLDKAGWAAKAEEGAFLIVAPQGLPARPGLEPNLLLNPRQWDSGQHGRGSSRTSIDDLRFFDDLLDDARERWRIDDHRIYAVGHSNGGSMAFRLATARSDRIAAIASVAGTCWVPSPRLSRPVPTLWILGTRDPLMPLDGGLTVLPWEVRKTPSLADGLTRWRAALGCDDEPLEISTKPEYILRDYGIRPSQAATLRLVLLPGHGHGWPGYPASQPLAGRPFYGPHKSNVDATEWIWRFLRQHRLENLPGDPPQAASSPVLDSRPPMIGFSELSRY